MVQPSQSGFGKILIVDDQSFNIDALLIILKYKIGIQTTKVCEHCFDGLEAIEIIKNDVETRKSVGLNQLRFDLILIDCNMPFLDGYETTDRIR